MRRRAGFVSSRRGHELVCNFGATAVDVACEGSRIELATDAAVTLEAGTAKLPPMTGALIR